MERNCNLDEITDGKRYGLNDMVKAGCHDCEGCSACCKGMGSSIVLDPLDIYELTTNLNQSMEQLLNTVLELHVVDGMILPNLKMVKETEQCSFLNAEGRCSIHGFRPGICRLFPLGRVYEDGSFSYVLQTMECAKTNRTKVKVGKWIDTPELNKHEPYITEWHYFIKELGQVVKEATDEMFIKRLTMYVLQQFYMKPYETDRDFYEQFDQRLTEAKQLLGL